MYAQIQSKSHPDLLIVNALDEEGEIKNEIGVDDIRNAVRFMRSTSLQGGWRVVMIDSAEKMNRNAANALLKVLEEPPAKTILILIASTLGRFPATIRSRCRLLRFQPLEYGQVLNILQILYPNESPARLQLAANLSDGSVGQAVRIIELEAEGFDHEIKELLSTIPIVDDLKLLVASDRFFGAKSKQISDLVFKLLLRALRQAILDFSHESRSEKYFSSMRQYRPVSFWLDAYQEINEWIEQMRGLHLDPKQVWMNIFIRLRDVKLSHS